MTDKLVERVARAICAADYTADCVMEDRTACTVDNCFSMVKARAAIEAIMTDTTQFNPDDIIKQQAEEIKRLRQEIEILRRNCRTVDIDWTDTSMHGESND